MILAEAVVDSSGLITEAIGRSALLHFIVCQPDGAIQLCNEAFARGLGVTCEQLLDQPLTSYLAEADAARFENLVAHGARDLETAHLLNFVNAKGERYTLVCRIAVQPGRFTLIGEPVMAEELALRHELHELNNSLATLARENARKSKELAQAKAQLERTIEELNRSHWHLRKVAEVLPMCIECGKVKASEATWQDVAEYFHNNSLFVSHGCCPECEPKMARKWGL